MDNGKIYKHYIEVYLKIIVGTFIYAIGFQYFCYHNEITTGGVTGIAMIINHLTGIKVGILSICINIPLFLYSWRKFGLGFMIASVVGMALSSIFIDLLSMWDFNATDDLLLACVFAGVLKGYGLGLVYSTGATTGGVDIVAKVLRQKYQHINFSSFILFMDVAIVAAFAVIFEEYESSMYAMICMFIFSRMIDVVMTGAVKSKVCYIISDKSEKIKDIIFNELNRGVTFIKGEGAYSGKEKKIILCAIKSREIVGLKHIVMKEDENAFVFVTDSHEVFGDGFTFIGEEG